MTKETDDSLEAVFPPLPLGEWRPARDALHAYCKVLGKVRGSLTPPQKHWGHVSLRVSPQGIATPPIPFPGRQADSFQIHLDLLSQRVSIEASWNEGWQAPLSGQSSQAFFAQVKGALAAMGIHPPVDPGLFSDTRPLSYQPEKAAAFHQALSAVEAVLRRFKAGLPGETSPVQFWPHNFDLALMWLSGRKVPGQDPDKEEYADEQMSFGFSTGDEGVPDAYFYATAYPWPENLEQKPLPEGASWHTQGWKGALLMYAGVSPSAKPGGKLLRFLRAVYQAGSDQMR